MKYQLPQPEFTFAGFTFPKWLWTLPAGAETSSFAHPLSKFFERKALLEQRAKDRKSSCTGPYYHSPTPNSKGQGGYELPMRWKYCDDIADMRHTGWWCDKFHDHKMRGVVIRLPKSRGFLIGWTMGEGMACSVETDEVYDDETEAAYEADRLAMDAAERELDYQEQETQKLDNEAEAPETEYAAAQRKEREAFDDKWVPGAFAAADALKRAVLCMFEIGLVPTVETFSIAPLAMGRYGLRVTYRLSRKIYQERSES